MELNSYILLAVNVLRLFFYFNSNKPLVIETDFSPSFKSIIKTDFIPPSIQDNQFQIPIIQQKSFSPLDKNFPLLATVQYSYAVENYSEKARVIIIDHNIEKVIKR